MFGLDPATLIARIIVLIFAFSIHEFAHAWTATQFGDDTPRQYGRLTLNPLAHLDPMGSLVLLLQTIPVSFAGIGVREGAYAYLFTVFGLAPEKGVLIGIVFFSQMLILAGIGGLLELFEH